LFCNDLRWEREDDARAYKERARSGVEVEKKKNEPFALSLFTPSLSNACSFFSIKKNTPPKKMAASRPLVTVQGLDGTASGQTALPAVFTAPIRPDVVLQVRYARKSRRLF